MGELGRKETIDERLARLNRELDEALGKHQNAKCIDSIDNLDRLFGLGLTVDQAKYWLEHEPNFVPSDDFLQRKKSDEDLTAPIQQAER